MRNYLALLFSALIVFFSCSTSKEEGTKVVDFNVSGILLPETIECEPGEKVSLKVMGSNGPQATDKVVLAGTSTFEISIAAVEKGSFEFEMPQDIFSGDFVFSISRGGQLKRVGNVRLVVTDGYEIDPGEANIYGRVSCKGAGVQGVVVSDGIQTVLTDSEGVYRLQSNKPLDYVFISVPSGYEPQAVGAIPVIHRSLSDDKDVADRCDFSLDLVDNQTNHTMLVIGDIHLADRNNDRTQFKDFVDDVNATIPTLGSNVYGLTLGDMVWDAYWLVNDYSFPEYISDVNRIKNLKIYQTIGNHDHSMYYTGDFKTVQDYWKNLGPSYYSFNVGDVHYVVIDDIECTNSKQTKDSKGNVCYEREYNDAIVSDIITWLGNDLSHVSKEKSLVVTMHIPMYSQNGSIRLKGDMTTFENLIQGFHSTHIFTAHTHIIYNVDKLQQKNIYEHNAGAVCGTWWWSDVETPGVHIGADGSPGGYTILTANGNELKWQFKATGSSTDYQFRTYDRNNIHITADKYVKAGSADAKANFKTGLWATPNSENEVYINIWNWDPAWQLEVKEGNTVLEYTQVSTYDPLHLIAYTAKRLNKSADATLGLTRNDTQHIFMVKASGPDTTLDIKVTDRFSNVYTEKMTRPKDFNTDIYKK